MKINEEQVQIIRITTDGTAVGVLGDKLCRGKPVKVPLSDLEVVEVTEENGVITRVRHWNGQIYSVCQISYEERTREVENDLENIAKHEVFGTPLADLSRAFTENGTHTFYEWTEI